MEPIERKRRAAELRVVERWVDDPERAEAAQRYLESVLAELAVRRIAARIEAQLAADEAQDER